MPLKVELALEGVVDRLDQLPQRLEQPCARPLGLTLSSRPHSSFADVGFGEPQVPDRHRGTGCAVAHGLPADRSRLLPEGTAAEPQRKKPGPGTRLTSQLCWWA
jgi:hypothetical protein